MSSRDSFQNDHTISLLQLDLPKLHTMKFEDGNGSFLGHCKDSNDYDTINGRTVYKNMLTMKSTPY